MEGESFAGVICGLHRWSVCLGCFPYDKLARGLRSHLIASGVGKSEKAHKMRDGPYLQAEAVAVS